MTVKYPPMYEVDPVTGAPIRELPQGIPRAIRPEDLPKNRVLTLEEAAWKPRPAPRTAIPSEELPKQRVVSLEEHAQQNATTAQPPQPPRQVVVQSAMYEVDPVTGGKLRDFPTELPRAVRLEDHPTQRTLSLEEAAWKPRSMPRTAITPEEMPKTRVLSLEEAAWKMRTQPKQVVTAESMPIRQAVPTEAMPTKTAVPLQSALAQKVSASELMLQQGVPPGGPMPVLEEQTGKSTKTVLPQRTARPSPSLRTKPTQRRLLGSARTPEGHHLEVFQIGTTVAVLERAKTADLFLLRPEFASLSVKQILLQTDHSPQLLSQLDEISALQAVELSNARTNLRALPPNLRALPPTSAPSPSASKAGFATPSGMWRDPTSGMTPAPPRQPPRTPRRIQTKPQPLAHRRFDRYPFRRPGPEDYYRHEQTRLFWMKVNGARIVWDDVATWVGRGEHQFEWIRAMKALVIGVAQSSATLTVDTAPTMPCPKAPPGTVYSFQTGFVPKHIPTMSSLNQFSPGEHWVFLFENVNGIWIRAEVDAGMGEVHFAEMWNDAFPIPYQYNTWAKMDCPDNAQGMTLAGENLVYTFTKGIRLIHSGSSDPNNWAAERGIPEDWAMFGSSLDVDDTDWHYGDPCYNPRDDLIYVPITGNSPYNQMIGVFDRGLNTVAIGFLNFPDLGTFNGWCAIEPSTGLLYTSSHEPTTTIHKFAMTLSRPNLRLDHVGDVALHTLDPIIFPLNIIQGSAFAPSGHLYLAVDKSEPYWSAGQDDPAFNPWWAEPGP